DIGGLIGERRHIVHARTERHALSPVAELHVLFDTGVQVSDARTRIGDGLTVDFQYQAQHTVCRRVLGPHINHDVVAGRVFSVDGVPVLAGDVEDRALGGFGAAGVRIGGH